MIRIQNFKNKEFNLVIDGMLNTRSIIYNNEKIRTPNELKGNDDTLLTNRIESYKELHEWLKTIDESN